MQQNKIVYLIPWANKSYNYYKKAGRNLPFSVRKDCMRADGRENIYILTLVDLGLKK
ncbi:hypothetical protein [Lachnoclostridium phytofermentans]|uniref:hypothetical protein n=1 Tax=Lachnoclostridium phytofermentans TaxID=66219 RepID=UPI000A995A36|nr:hypothetical protein [Lachnoclostridium phytofermentans]